MQLQVYCDASYNFDSNKAGIAVIVKKVKSNGNKIIIKTSKIIDSKDNTEAEIRALLLGIYVLKGLMFKDCLPENSNITIYCDSKSVVKIVRTKKVNNQLLEKIQDDLAYIRQNNIANLVWINRKYNKEADKLARTKLQAYNSK